MFRNLKYSKLALILCVFFVSSVSATLSFTPNEVGLTSFLECTINSSTVENHVNSIKNNIYVTVEETSANTALFEMHYPTNSNNSDYIGIVAIYKSGVRQDLEITTITQMNDSAGYIRQYILNTLDGSYNIRSVIGLASDTSKTCTVRSENFNIQQFTIPTIQSVEADPPSVVAGDSITFNAILSSSLPNNYSMEIDFGAGDQVMSGSNTSFSLSSGVSTPGNNRPFTVSLKSNTGSVVSTMSGTFTVTSVGVQHDPVLTYSGASSNATVGTQYCVTFHATDQDDNLKNLQVSWDGSGTDLVVFSYPGGSGSHSEPMCHTYTQATTLTWVATLRDHTGRTSQKTKTITITTSTGNATPVVNANNSVAVSGNTLTANVTSTDDNSVTKVSFSIFDAGSSTPRYTETEITSVSPASNYNADPSANSWGYITSGTPINSNWIVNISGLPDGNYDIQFNAADSALQIGTSGKQPFIKTSAPTITVNTPVSVTNNILTANVTSEDNSIINKVSFTVFDAGSNTSRNTQNEIVVIAPASTYNPDPSANSWGYTTSTSTVISPWQVDISGLPVGSYEIEFNALDDSGNVSHSAIKHPFSRTAGNIPGFTGPPTVTESGNLADPLEFKVVLDGPLPENHEVYINFDDQQGDWLSDTDLGGHTLMTNTTGNTYTLLTGLTKPGLRYFHMGIFDTLGDNQANTPGLNEINSENDIWKSWSAHNICDVDYCINATIQAEGIGNPAISRSGSQLFKNVDVASGNFHLSTIDLAVPGIGPSFAFSRAYNSRADQQWTFGYEAKATFKENTYNRQLAIGPMEDGRFLNFFKNIDFDNNANNDEWFALDQGNFNKIIENGDGSFTLYTQGNRIYKFESPSDPEEGRLIHIQDRLNHTLTMNYNAGDNFVDTLTDANSRNYTIGRDGSNRIIRITDFTGRYVSYTYDATSGHIENVRDPRGETSKYFYTYNNVLTLSYAPDSAYRLLKQNNQKLETQYTLTYDDKGQVTQVLDGDNKTTGFTYPLRSAAIQFTGIIRPDVDTVINNIVFIIDSKRSYVLEKIDSENVNDYTSTREYLQPTNRTRFAERALVSKSIEPLNQETTTNYKTDGSGNPLNIIEDDGGSLTRTTSATWDTVSGQNNLTPMKSLTKPGITTSIRYSSFTQSGKAKTTTDAMNNPRYRAYSASTDLMSSTTDAENNQTHFTYFSNGYLKDVTDAKGKKTSSTYDLLGRIKTTTTPLGLVTTYNYDASGNIISMVEAGDGHTYTTDYNYDEAGNMTWSEDPKNFRTNYTYDALGRKKTEYYTVNSVTHTRSYDYDALGRLATTINELNQTTDTFYTARGKIKSVDMPENETIRYTYDANGNIKTIKDGDNRITTKTYDDLNRPKRTTDHNGNYEEYTYNSAGFVDTYRNKNGEKIKYTYDNNGNQKTLSYVGHSELGTVNSYYDKNNNLEKVVDAEGNSTFYFYDVLNQLEELKDNSGNQWKYTYDANGNQLTETMPDGEKTVNTYDPFNRVKTQKEYSSNNNGNTLLRSISYTYDANGNVTSQSGAGSTLGYTYDELNRIETATGHYGNTNTIGYTYDKVGNIKTMVYPGNKTVSYNYNAANRMDDVTDWLGNTTYYVTRNISGQIKNVTLGNNTRIVKNYDAAGRLISLTNKKSTGAPISSHTNMGLDKVGNIKSATIDLPLTPQVEIGKVQTYDNNNRIVTSGGDSYSHDLNGRITQNTQSGDNIVYNFNTSDLITKIDTNGVTTSQYTYNISDNRVSSTINGVQTRYIVNENSGLPNVIAETNTSNVVQRYYIYGAEGLLEQIDSGGNVKFYHYDPTGNTLALTNGSQTITDKYAYSPYGTVSQDDNNTSINPFLYSGKHGVMDDENGLNYMRARYYKSDIKRFMSLDGVLGSVSDPQSLNRYAYVLGNPIMGVDPSGFECNGVGFNSPITYDTKELSGELIYYALDIDSCSGFNKEQFGTHNKVNNEIKAINFSTDNYIVGDSANGYGSQLGVSANKTEEVSLGFSNTNVDGKQTTTLEATAGATVGVGGTVGFELFGVRISISPDLQAGASIGGSASGYSDSKYTGVNASGEITALLGVKASADIAVNRQYWSEKKETLDKATNSTKSYYNYLVDCGFFGATGDECD